MFHDDESETEILFSGDAGFVTWEPDGPIPPVTNDSGPMPFDIGEGRRVSFLYDMNGAGPLPLLPLVFLGTSGDTVFSLEPGSEWSSNLPDQFTWSNWRTTASKDGGLVIVGTVDIGDFE